MWFIRISFVVLKYLFCCGATWETTPDQPKDGWVDEFAKGSISLVTYFSILRLFEGPKSLDLFMRF